MNGYNNPGSYRVFKKTDKHLKDKDFLLSGPFRTYLLPTPTATN